MSSDFTKSIEFSSSIPFSESSAFTPSPSFYKDIYYPDSTHIIVDTNTPITEGYHTSTILPEGINNNNNDNGRNNSKVEGITIVIIVLSIVASIAAIGIIVLSIYYCKHIATPIVPVMDYSDESQNTIDEFAGIEIESSSEELPFVDNMILLEQQFNSNNTFSYQCAYDDAI